MSLTLREVQLADLETFRQWRADPRYAEMLRQPGVPASDEDAIDWYRSVAAADFWSVWKTDRLRGYVLLTRRHGGAEVSILTDPDNPCDPEALTLLIAKAEQLGIRRLFAETYTRWREDLVMRAGFQPVQHWTLLLRRPGPTSG